LDTTESTSTELLEARSTTATVLPVGAESDAVAKRGRARRNLVKSMAV
jgi:hypothetical protein